MRKEFHHGKHRGSGSQLVTLAPLPSGTDLAVRAAALRQLPASVPTQDKEAI